MTAISHDPSNGAVSDPHVPAPPAPATPVEYTLARSTGPRTQNGKAIVAQNALTHGIYSSRPVIPSAETEEEWDAFRTGIVESLAPASAVQLALAERAAEYFWRLRRVARYEAVVAADKIDRAERDAVPGSQPGIDSLRNVVTSKQDTLDRLRRLPTLRDETPIPNEEAWEIVGFGIDAVECVVEEKFTVPGVSGSVQYLSFYAWTARHVRDALAYLDSLRRDGERSWPDGKALLADITGDAEKAVRAAQAQVAAAEREAARLRRRRAFPTSKGGDRAMRAEAHLSRQLITTLHEIEALQNRANGLPAHLARIDVNGSAAENPEMTKQTPWPGSVPLPLLIAALLRAVVTRARCVARSNHVIPAIPAIPAIPHPRILPPPTSATPNCATQNYSKLRNPLASSRADVAFPAFGAASWTAFAKQTPCPLLATRGTARLPCLPRVDLARSVVLSRAVHAEALQSHLLQLPRFRSHSFARSAASIKTVRDPHHRSSQGRGHLNYLHQSHRRPRGLS